MSDAIDFLALRKRFDLTQEQLAEELACDRSVVSRIESGKVKPRRATLKLAAQLLARLESPSDGATSPPSMPSASDLPCPEAEGAVSP